MVSARAGNVGSSATLCARLADADSRDSGRTGPDGFWYRVRLATDANVMIPPRLLRWLLRGRVAFQARGS